MRNPILGTVLSLIPATIVAVSYGGIFGVFLFFTILAVFSLTDIAYDMKEIAENMRKGHE